MKKLFVWLSKSAKIVSKLAKMNTKVVCYICHLRKMLIFANIILLILTINLFHGKSKLKNNNYETVPTKSARAKVADAACSLGMVATAAGGC